MRLMVQSSAFNVGLCAQELLTKFDRATSDC